MDSQLLELLITNITRLDETQPEDATGVHNILNIIENLTELRPAVCYTMHFQSHV